MQSKVIEFRNPAYPWPDRPNIPELVLEDPSKFDGSEEDTFEPPSDGDISEREHADASSPVPVPVGGAIDCGRDEQVARSSEGSGVRGSRAAVKDGSSTVPQVSPAPHRTAARVRRFGSSRLDDPPVGSQGTKARDRSRVIVCAGHAVWRRRPPSGGRPCSFFGQCPKPGKRECLVPGCGSEPFLRQFEKYSFNPAQFERAAKVTLFDRASGFLVHPPRIEAMPTRFAHRARNENFDDKDGNR